MPGRCLKKKQKPRRSASSQHASIGSISLRCSLAPNQVVTLQSYCLELTALAFHSGTITMTNSCA